MSFGFLNILMLTGLAAVTLPILAHLLSKRRFDVVHWGAMRFLELGQRTQRRIRIQDLLLLLLRMGLIALLALALARPWGQGSVISAIGPTLSRDVVFILDGSASMDWRGGRETPHHLGIQWIHDALEDLRPGDTATLIDARTQARLVVHPPTGNFRIVRDALVQLPGPAGPSDLVRAISEAAKVLATTTNVSREIIVLTDGQVFPWRLNDEFAWTRLDDLLRQPEVPPSLHLVELGEPGERTNVSVDRLGLSRDFTVPGFPIRIRTAIRQSGGTVTNKSVSLEVDGQRLHDQTRAVNLLPDGEALVEFEHVFDTEGTFIASVVLEEDLLPGDDRADGVITVKSGVPVLLVDGDPHLDEVRSETFFIKSVFAASSPRTPWVKTAVVRQNELNAKLLSGQRVVFVCNVDRLNEESWGLLRDFVAEGGGLVVAPGGKTDAQVWNRLNSAGEPPLLPAAFGVQVSENLDEDPVKIDSLSLETPWLSRFRKEHGIDFWQTRFSKWWELTRIAANEPADADDDAGPENRSRGPLELARLTNGAPLMISAPYGKGTVLQLAVPLDAEWSTWPARSDFVPFLHEMVFVLSPNVFPRNVDVGAPLFFPLTDQEVASNYTVDGPGIKEASPQPEIEGAKVVAAWRETGLPGIYRFHRKENGIRGGAAGEPIGHAEPFVVADDRLESNLTLLTDEQRELLADQYQVYPVSTMGELTAERKGNLTRTELWWILLLLMLAMLVGEVALTRKMVQGGHAVLEPLEDAELPA